MGALFETDLMKKHLKSFRDMEILFGILFVAFCFFGPSTFVSNSILLMFILFYVVWEMIIFDKYLTYPIELNTKGYLVSTLKYHSFDSDEFFKKLRTKIIVMEGIMAGGFCISAVAYRRAELIPFVLLLIGVPAAIAYFAKWFFEYCLTHELATSTGIILKFAYGLFKGLAVLALGIYGLLVMLLGYGMLSDANGIPNVAEGIVAYRVYDNFLIGIMVIAFCVYVSLAFYLKYLKYCKQFEIVALIVLLVCFFGGLVMEQGQNTMIMEGHIVNTTHFKTTEYAYSDVDAVQVSMGSEDLKMDLVMKDGTQIKVIASEFTNTEAWSEKYYSLYNYLPDLTEDLLTAGAKGNITDVEKIREYVSGLDPQCVQGTEELIQLLQ